jgi:hypothetical protein
MSRRRKLGSIPAPPEIAKAAQEYKQFFAKHFPQGFKPERPPPPKLAATSSRGSSSSAAAKKTPKPGSAAAWIDELYPNDARRLLMTGKQVHNGIAQEADMRGLKKWPSYSAVLLELKTRRQQQK